MESYRKFWGIRCVLTPEDVAYSRTDYVLNKDLGAWNIKPDGSATLNVFRFLRDRCRIMESFSEGLDQNFFFKHDLISS